MVLSEIGCDVVGCVGVSEDYEVQGEGEGEEEGEGGAMEAEGDEEGTGGRRDNPNRALWLRSCRLYAEVWDDVLLTTLYHNNFDGYF